MGDFGDEGPPQPPSLWSRRCSRDLSLHSSLMVREGGRGDHPPGTTRQERPLWAPCDFRAVWSPEQTARLLGPPCV